jgi:hypothetical protein
MSFAANCCNTVLSWGIGQALGGIAHDFNHLLAAVVGNLELLQLRVASDERALQLAGAAFQAAMRGTKPDRPALGLFTNPEARSRCNRRKRRAARHGRIAGAYGRLPMPTSSSWQF